MYEDFGKILRFWKKKILRFGKILRFWKKKILEKKDLVRRLNK